MASTIDSDSSPQSLILKTNSRGHVRMPVERQQALLVEFDRSGLCGKQFARLSGINYSTFQYWLQRRKLNSGNSEAGSKKQQLTWVEAMVQQASPAVSSGLLVHFPGGARAEILSQQHIALAAALVRALEKPC